MDLFTIIATTNVAELLSEEKKVEIGNMVKQHFDTDVTSREDWEKAVEKWIAMTNQAIEYKTKPWPGAANIKYPLMTQAALNFNSRVVPALMPNNEPVGIEIHGPDPALERTKIAQAVAQHMNFQLITEMEEWEEEMDRMLITLPILGMTYKKTYFDSIMGRNVSRHVSPLNLVVNYYADRLETSRKTEIHEWSKNVIMEKIALGAFSEVDWDTHPDPTPTKKNEVEARSAENMGFDEPHTVDSATPYTVLEYHGWLDLDEDGYEEPYIVTMIEDSRQVLSIVPRFDEDVIMWGPDGELIAITPYESYTKYGFIPNPDGSFYDIGFGQLLYPINATVNTAINMMLDAGASSIMNSGFVGRGLKMRGGMFSMAPNTWLTVNSTGEDIRKSFVPMPTKEPSQVLLTLMMYMVEAGQKLSSTTDIFSGEMPGQNTKAGVTQAVRDEGQKIFTGIYKRIRAALKKELIKLYELNGIVLGAGENAANTKIARSAGVFQVSPEFYNREMVNIQPSADPNVAIKEQKVQKALGALQLIQGTGIGNVALAQKAVLIAMEVDNVDALQPEDAQAPVDPKQQAEQIKAQIEASQADFDARMAEREQRLKEWEAQTNAQLDYMRILVQQDRNANDFGLKLADLEIKETTEVANARGDMATETANEGSVRGMEGAPS